MEYKQKFIDHIKKAVVDLKAENEPTSGKVCAVASVRTLRDLIIPDVVAMAKRISENVQKTTTLEDAKKASVEFAEDIEASIKDAFLEVINSVRNKAESGFASNASAAAKSAGFKVVSTAQKITEDLED